MEVSHKSVMSRKVGILSLSTLSMITLCISPSYAAIGKAFQASNTLVQMLTSLPNLAALVAGLVIGKIASTKLSHKTLSIIALALILLGGLSPLIYHANIGFLLLCSAVMGFGQGMISNLVQILITSELPEDQRQSTMGKNTAFSNLGAMVVIFLGGILAAKSWVNNYMVFFFPILILIIVIFALPNRYNEQVKTNDQKETTTESKSVSLNKYTWQITFCSFFSMLIYNVYANNISIYITEHHIGGSSQAGTASMIGLFGGLVCGIFVAKLAKVFGASTIGISFITMALSFLIVGFTTSLIVVMIGSFLSGAGLSLCMAQYPYLISISVDSATAPTAFGFYNACLAFGGALSPIIINAIMVPFKNSAVLNTFTVSGIIALVIGLIVIFSRFQNRIIQRSQDTDHA
ncbi:MFS transporter [Secundilactobacillus collinoides]|nr:MFS transporter [Secundilactobacillus collinoides]KZL39420.1 hypothetical protein TY91_10535 [Secundilactobacillus collinoides]